MSNAQNYPQSVYPIKGDVDSEVGNSTVTVTGIQTVPVANTAPAAFQTLVLEGGTWTPDYSPFNRSLQVNGLGVSDDYWVFIAHKDTEVQVNSSFSPSGFPILVAGSPANTF